MAHLEIIRPAQATPWGRFKASMRSYWRGPFGSGDRELARLMGAGPTDAGVSVSEVTALNYSAVWQAVSLIAGDVGSLPLLFYKRLSGGGKERYGDHPLYYVLHDAPNPEMSSMVFRETLQAHLLTWGNAYAEIERDQVGRVKHLWPLLPNQVYPYRDAQGRVYYEISPDGVRLPAADVLHVPGLGFDGLCGYSPIRQARESLGLLAASEKFGATFFGNGTTFGGALKHPKVLGPEGQKTLRDSIDSLHKGPSKAHRFLILEEGMDFTRFGVNPNDAQFLETRKFQIAEIARWFNLPLHKLREMDNSSVRANIEQEALDYYVSTLRPWLTRWEQEINRKLVSPRERYIQYAEFLLDGVLRGDMASRYSAYATARQWGWLSVDEIRERENMNPLPDGTGKTYLSPMNMTPADRLDEVIDKQVAPTPAPAASPEPADDAGVRALLREATDRIEAQATTIGSLQAEVEQHAARLAERESAHAEAVSARDAAHAVAVEQVVAQERATLAMAEARVSAVTEDRDRLRSALTDAEMADTRTRDAARRLEAQLLEMQAHAAAVMESLAAEREARAAADEARAAAEALVETLRVEMTTAHAEQSAVVEVLRQSGEAAEQLAAEAAAEVDRLTTELTAAREAAEAQVAAARQERDAAQAAEVAAEAVVVELRQSVSETAQRAAEADAELERRTTEYAAMRTALESDVDTARTANDQATRSHRAHVTSLVTAHRSVYVDAVRRLVYSECERAKARQATPEKLRRWLAGFVSVEETRAAEILRPAVAVHLSWLQSDADAALVAEQVAREHVAAFVAQVESAMAAPPEDFHADLERVLERWESSRPESVADGWLQEEVEHVRTRESAR